MIGGHEVRELRLGERRRGVVVQFVPVRPAQGEARGPSSSRALINEAAAAVAAGELAKAAKILQPIVATVPSKAGPGLRLALLVIGMRGAAKK